MSLLKKISSNFENPYHGSGSGSGRDGSANNANSEKEFFSTPENLSNKKKNFSNVGNAAACGDEDNVKREPARVAAKQIEQIEPGDQAAAQASTQPANSPPTTSPELPAAVPCLFCSCPAIWLDFNGNVHCYQCEPPPSQSMIHGRWTLSEGNNSDNDSGNGGPATWIDRGRPERSTRSAPVASTSQSTNKSTAKTSRKTTSTNSSTTTSTTNPPPAAAVPLLDKIGHDNAEPWIETTETDSTGRVVTIHRPASLAARGPVMGEGFSSFERDPDDPTGKRLIFSGWTWFDW